MKEVKPRALLPLPLLLLAGSLLLAAGLAQDGAPRRVVKCDVDTCFLLIAEALNFTSARDACDALKGGLATLRSAEQRATARGLLLSSSGGGGGGRFWIGLTLPAARRCPAGDAELHGYEWTDGDGGSGGVNVSAWHSVPDRCEHRCVSVSSDGSWRQEPCGGALSGVLCVTQAGWCPAAEPSSVPGQRVVSPAHEPAFSAGSTRRLHPPGTKLLTDGGKWLCAWGDWLKAPWSCEVMTGGCAHACRDGACTCPAGQVLRADNLTCVDADECRRGEPCARENAECAQREFGGRWECACRDGWAEDEEEGRGVCLDVRVCLRCEHLKCVKVAGAYTCVCSPGFAVSREDPTRCQPACDRDECPAACVAGHCHCPDGYLYDETRDNASTCVDVDECRDTEPCDHVCVNTRGSYTCLCNPGYRMHDMSCVPDPTTPTSSTTTPTTSSSSTTSSTPLSAAAGVPPYVRVGSALGMSVFVAVGVALAYLLLRHAHRRCVATFEVPPLDLSLQQVTTGKYQRFSFDKESQRADGQRL